MRFFTGLHQPSDARHFDDAFVSVKRLRMRKSDFVVRDWIMDSGAFTEIRAHGAYRHSVAEYAREIRRWRVCGRMLAAVAQDWMCEPHIVKRTLIADGLLPVPAGCERHGPISDALLKALYLPEWQHAARVQVHQRRTIERYDALLEADTGAYILPVLQGFAPEDYVAHVRLYGARLGPEQWVGVGSVCKRNGTPAEVAVVLLAIKRERPDLRLHGFGLKTTALADPLVRSMLHSADSMAWCMDAWRAGRNSNDYREAKRWALNITSRPVQHLLDFLRVTAAGCPA